MCLSTGAGWDLLDFAARLQEGGNLTRQVVAVTNRQFFFRFAGHIGNLGIYRKKLHSIHQICTLCQAMLLAINQIEVSVQCACDVRRQRIQLMLIMWVVAEYSPRCAAYGGIDHLGRKLKTQKMHC